MLLSYPAFGIELGDGALKAVKLQRRGARLVVTWAQYLPYARAEDGAVRPRAGLNPRAAQALKQFLDETPPGRLDRIFVGLPSVATFNRLIMVPDVGEERLREITHYETVRSLRGPIEDYVVRTRILRQRRGHDEIPCLLYAVRRDIRDALVTDMAAHGLEFDNMIPSPAALALFGRYDRPAKGDRIIISLGLRSTEIVYLRDRGHAFRTLPLGVVGFEGLDRGGADRKLATARHYVDRVASEVQKGSAFFFSGQTAFSTETITLFGEGAEIPEVVDEFRRHFPLQVESAGSLHRIVIDPSVPQTIRERVPQMGTALGLAIAAARAENPPIVLLDRNRSRDAARRLPGLAIASIIVSLCAFLAARFDIAEAERIASIDIRPKPADVRARTTLETSLIEEGRNLQIVEKGIARFALSRTARTDLLTRLVRNFGPETADYGEIDLRLIDCKLERAEHGSNISGRVRAPLLDVRTPTILRQRLSAVGGFSNVTVEEIEAERNEYDETTLYSFQAQLVAGGLE